MKFLSLLFCALPLASLAQTTSATDLLVNGGCLEREALTKFANANQGQVVFQFEGNMLFSKFSEDTRLTFIRYQYQNQFRTALVARDQPFDASKPEDKSKACVLFAGDERGSVANPREGLPPAQWWFQEYEEEQAIARCKSLRPIVHSIWSSQLEDFGGSRQSREQNLLIGVAALNGIEAARRERQTYRDQLATNQGDRWCASPMYLRNLAMSDDRKLVALLTGTRFEYGSKEVAEKSVLLAIFVSNKPGPKSLGWTIYFVQPSGASYKAADGHGFRFCEDCFAKK
jgi:hypothetical protein